MTEVKITLTFEVADYYEDALHMLLEDYGGDDLLDTNLAVYHFEWAEERANDSNKSFFEFYFPWKITEINV